MRRVAVFFIGVFFLYTAFAVADSRAARMELFHEICETVEKNFYDADVAQTQFSKIKSNYKNSVASAKTKEEFSSTVNAMLGQLNVSHTVYLSPRDYAYYHLASVFSKLPNIQNVFDGKKITYPTIGVLTEEIHGKIFVTEVLPKSAAERAGVLRGDRIVDVDGRPYQAIDSLKKHVGKKVSLRIKRTAAGKKKTLEVVPEIKNPHDEMLEAEKESIRIIEADSNKIGYIHIYSYTGREFHDELIAAISWGKLKDVDALIIDLRYGLGGADPTYLNMFNRKVPVIAATGRDGVTRRYDPQWRKPVAYLVNHASRSGKEILAFGAKKHNLATVIGERTAGAVLAGRLFVLSNNDFLYLAVARSSIDGVDLEGVGVAPDIEVPMDIRYCAGTDAQLSTAVTHLKRALEERSTKK